VNADDDRRDGPDPRHDELGFDDPEHAWVRDLLADARVTEPVPDDVAARLDATLSALQARRSGDLAASEPSRLAPVVPLRRRLGQRLGQRLGPALVAAAAVIVVIGGGIGLVRSANHSGSSATVSADSAGSAAERRSESGQDSAKAPPAGGSAKSARDIPELTTASFGPDAARVMQQVALSAALSDVPNQTTRAPAPSDNVNGTAGTPGYTSESQALQAPPVTDTPRTPFGVPESGPCHGPSVPGAVTLQALLDGARVALVFLPPTATGQEVQAWSCDGPR